MTSALLELPPIPEINDVQARCERGRRYRIVLQHVLLVMALLLFAASLPLPAVLYDPYGNGHQQFDNGAECLLLGILYYPSNAWLLASPITFLLVRRSRGPFAHIILALASTASMLWVAQVPTCREFRAIGSGCIVWIAAHGVVTLASFLPVWRDSRPPAAKRSRGESGFPVIMRVKSL